MTKLKNIQPVGARVTEIAERNGYAFLLYNSNTGDIHFTKGDVKITVYLAKMTVATAMNHPKQGKTQMFRKNVSFDELERICKNPREHTGKGYKTKKNHFVKK